MLEMDQSFGPGIQCSQFDFTITFEHIIFGITASTIFLILIILRLWRLFRKETVTVSHPVLWAKLVGFLLPNDQLR